jgi:hypothetical protein
LRGESTPESSLKGILMRCLLFAVSLGLLTLAPTVFAADADVCHSPASPDPAYLLTSSTPLKCPRAGTHTLPELAQAGWTLVSVQSVTAGMADPSHPTTAWLVVIEKR